MTRPVKGRRAVPHRGIVFGTFVRLGGSVSAEAVGALVAALAFILNAWSVLYLAKQTKTAAQQTSAAVRQVEISNAVAAASANDTVLQSLREVHLLMLDREGMRDYFYGGRPLPDTGAKRDEVLTIAELLCDVMSSGVHTHERVPDSESAGPWADYCRHTVGSSPAVCGLLREHPMWWPHLLSVLPDGFLEAESPARVPAPRPSSDGS
ncbi:hypothetical protein [Streptomyces zhihengii]